MAITRQRNLRASAATRSEGSASSILLAAVRAKDEQAWERFVRVFSPLVYHWCRRFGLGHEDASDVAQEVFAAVARYIGGFHREKPEDTFRGWLRTITRHKIYDTVKSRGMQPQAAGGPQTGLGNVAFNDLERSDEEEETERDMILHHALDLVRSEFSPATMAIFTRVVMNEESPADIALDLGVSRDAIYKAKARVLHKLREQLDGLLD